MVANYITIELLLVLLNYTVSDARQATYTKYLKMCPIVSIYLTSSLNSGFSFIHSRVKCMLFGIFLRRDCVFNLK